MTVLASQDEYLLVAACFFVLLGVDGVPLLQLVGVDVRSWCYQPFILETPNKIFAFVLLIGSFSGRLLLDLWRTDHLFSWPLLFWSISSA